MKFIKWLFSFFPQQRSPGSVVIEKKQRKRKAQAHIDGVVPSSGNDWNPFQKYPRNETCYCGSGVKYKRCCVDSDPISIRINVAEQAKPLIQKARKKRAEKKNK